MHKWFAEWCSKTASYQECGPALVPPAESGLRFDTPSQNQGQIIEVSYGGWDRSSMDKGAPFKREIDHSTGGWRFYIWIEGKVLGTEVGSGDGSAAPGDIILVNGAYTQVTQVVSYPPGKMHTGPVREDLTAVEIKTAHGSRWLGCKEAHIGSDLRLYWVR